MTGKEPDRLEDRSPFSVKTPSYTKGRDHWGAVNSSIWENGNLPTQPASLLITSKLRASYDFKGILTRKYW